MDLEAQKLHLIEEVLKADSGSVLTGVENVFNTYKYKPVETRKPTNHDFIGIISEEEAGEMKRAIAGTCENLDAND